MEALILFLCALNVVVPISSVLAQWRGSPPVSTRDENRTGTFMRQMRGENTGNRSIDRRATPSCADTRFVINWKRKRDLCRAGPGVARAGNRKHFVRPYAR